jgi:aryl sulfotransferase
MATMFRAEDAATAVTPRKLRELRNHHFDSTVWNDFVFRDDDVVIATYAKSGTTWMQQIVGQLIFGGDPDLSVAELSPWMDLRVPPASVKLSAVEAQVHRRFVKTHLPVDALVFDPRAKYIYVARDGRDVVWSLHNHHRHANAAWYAALNDTPGRVGRPIPPADPDVVQYFQDWLDGDGAPFWPFWEHVRGWWALRELPNVLLVHFEAMRRDLGAEIRRVAAFLEIDIAPAAFPRILKHCGFDWMKANARRAAPLGGLFWDGGAETFIHRGTNGRWRERLGEQDCADYLAMARAELGDACADWLESGRR